MTDGPDDEQPAGESARERENAAKGSTSQPPATDPMKSFRGIVAATLILEAIVVGLALLVVAKTGGGVGSSRGFLVLALIVALLGTCALLRYRWSGLVIAGIHAVMLLSTFTFVALGVVGVLFTLTWICLFLLRRDVARKMAAGRLPSKQP
ncbi:MAG: DUF4233 domain-containing protein [Sciscionella sp.]